MMETLLLLCGPEPAAARALLNGRLQRRSGARLQFIQQHIKSPERSRWCDPAEGHPAGTA